MLYIGLMSGTSMDGVDAAVCVFEGQAFRGVIGHAQRAYPPELRTGLLRLQRELPAIRLGDLAQLDRGVAECFAAAALDALRICQVTPAQVAAIGSHGQTVFHDPAGAGSSLQLGDPNRIAAITGIDTVADFRRADIAQGGQGAPLVPAFHHAVFASRAPCAAVNIGGIANVTLLPSESGGDVTGFDTGPGNGLLDEWAELHLGCAYDASGRFAASGTIEPALLDALLSDPYFVRPPPKSTGRDYFKLDWVRRRYPSLDALPPENVQRTLCELTARTIAEALRASPVLLREVMVCGGGSQNAFLMQRLAALLAPIPVRDTGVAALDPAWVEAAAFAWLAMRRLERLPGNLPAVTGAAVPAILGGLYLAKPW